jgi:hypothetical protein
MQSWTATTSRVLRAAGRAHAAAAAARCPAAASALLATIRRPVSRSAVAAAAAVAGAEGAASANHAFILVLLMSGSWKRLLMSLKSQISARGFNKENKRHTICSRQNRHCPSIPSSL